MNERSRVVGHFSLDSVTVNKPIKCIDVRRGICVIDYNGDEAVTTINRLHYNGHTTLVSCHPLTGRTHQIRIHLAYLGFPIANDPSYGASLYLSNSNFAHLAYHLPSPQSPLPSVPSTMAASLGLGDEEASSFSSTSSFSVHKSENSSATPLIIAPSTQSTRNSFDYNEWLFNELMKISTSLTNDISSKESVHSSTSSIASSSSLLSEVKVGLTIPLVGSSISGSSSSSSSSPSSLVSVSTNSVDKQLLEQLHSNHDDQDNINDITCYMCTPIPSTHILGTHIH
jgi:hypothetical protein